MSSSLLLPEKIPWLAGKIFNYTPLLQNLLKELNKRVICIMLLLGFLLADISTFGSDIMIVLFCLEIYHATYGNYKHS